MSRLHNFKHAVISGYATLAANILYTFLSVPLALHYLTPEHFGLWALTIQIGGYIALIDMGMSGSVSRMLIDHKDRMSDGDYGGILKTGALVGAVQALIVLAVGVALALPLGRLLHIPDALRSDLLWLVVGQAVILAFSFVARIFQHLLVAHQRYDISNYGQAAVFCLSLLGMWAGFAAGWGVFSLLAVQFAGAIVVAIINLIAALRLNLLPARGAWGRASMARFKELFSYGSDLFLYSIGMQIINASQTILLTRFMGLDVAALWNVGTRCFAMLGSILWRMQEFSGPPLAEMYVRGEMVRLRDRLRDVGLLTTNLAIFTGALLAVCNTPFMDLWTRGRMQWPPVNDLLLAFWLVALTAMRGHISLAGALKKFGFLRWIFLIEGALFFGLNVALREFDGITRLLAISILCTCALSLPYVLLRTRRHFTLAWGHIAAWYLSSWRFGWRVAVLGSIAFALTHRLDSAPRLAINAAVVGLLGACALVRYGLGPSLQQDIAGKLPAPIRRLFLSVTAT